MTYGCCVPWCNEPGKSKFRVPRSMLDAWEESLNIKLRSTLRICELHFDLNDIIRTSEIGQDYHKLTVDLRKPKLRPGAIPKDFQHNDILVEFLNFPSINKKKELTDYRNVLHDHSYCFKHNLSSVTLNLPTIKTPWNQTDSIFNEYCMPLEPPSKKMKLSDETFNNLSNLNYSNLKFINESLQPLDIQTKSVLVESLSTASENINLSNNSLHCAQTEINELLIACSCCLRGIDFGNLIQCTSCNNIYHYFCHIPSITQNKIMQLLNKLTGGQNISHQPDFIDSSLTNWKCTLCIDLDLLCKKISQKDSSDTNYVYERAVMKNILLKLYCQVNDSIYFRTCLDKQLFPSYYEKIKNPISLDDIKTKLCETNAYKLFLHLIQDIELLVSNATQFYSKNTNGNNSAINLQTSFRIHLREVYNYLVKYAYKKQTNEQPRHPSSSVSLEKNEILKTEVKCISTKPFSELDIQYLIETTNNFMREDIFKEKFLKFLIKDRFKDHTTVQLLHKLRELQIKYKGVNNNVSNLPVECQPLRDLENLFVAKPQPSTNNLIEVKKRKFYSKEEIRYLRENTFNYNSELVHNDFFLQFLIDDRFNGLTVSELRSELLLLKNNFNNEKNDENINCIHI